MLAGILALALLESGPPWPPVEVARVGWLRWAVAIALAFVGATLVEEAGGSVPELFRPGAPVLTADQRWRQRIGGALVAVVGAGVGLLVLLGAHWLIR